MRIITLSNYISHKKLSLLKVDDILKLQQLKFYHWFTILFTKLEDYV